MKNSQRFRILPVRGKFHIYEVSGPVPILVAYRTTPERAAEDCRRWNMVAQADCDQGFGKPFMTQDITTIYRTLIDKYETLLSQLSRLQTQDYTADYVRGQLNGSDLRAERDRLLGPSAKTSPNYPQINHALKEATRGLRVSPKISQAKALARFSRYRAAQEAARYEEGG
jgi:hypothetical protein